MPSPDTPNGPQVNGRAAAGDAAANNGRCQLPLSSLFPLPLPSPIPRDDRADPGQARAHHHTIDTRHPELCALAGPSAFRVDQLQPVLFVLSLA